MEALSRGAVVLQTMCSRASPHRQGAVRPHGIPEQVTELLLLCLRRTQPAQCGVEGENRDTGKEGKKRGLQMGLREPERLRGRGGGRGDLSRAEGMRGAEGRSPHTWKQK